MENLRTYKTHYAKTYYKEVEIKAENKEDAKRISELKCPPGHHVVFTDETVDSIVDRIMNKK